MSPRWGGEVYVGGKRVPQLRSRARRGSLVSSKWMLMMLLFIICITGFAMLLLIDDAHEIKTHHGHFILVGRFFHSSHQIDHGPLLKIQGDSLWVSNINGSKFNKCVNTTNKNKRNPNTNISGYLLVHANGGLNQMKIGISDMVAITKLMNAIMVIPSLDHTSYWRDMSDFDDIFYYKTFKNVLKEDIDIVEKLPTELKLVKPLQKAPISWSKPSYYKKTVIQLLQKHKVVNFTHTDSRLVNTASPSIQRLRCKAMYEALKFHPEIEALARKLVGKMRKNGGPFMALHLRYEKDMLAFTGCSHNLTKEEDMELREMRMKNSNWKEKNINGAAKRREGQCPMTPREVALFLTALGYPSTTQIYIVAGEIYGERGVDDLREMYPNLHTHATLATEEEIEGFRSFKNRLAAVDYLVALESDAFVYSYDGNMARAITGHRKYEGFKKTISPDKGKYVKLIDKLESGKISFDQFSKKVRSLCRGEDDKPYPRVAQGSRKGHIKDEENFYANPYPECICEKKEQKR